MIRLLSIALLLAAPVPLLAQSFDDTRAVTVAAIEYQRRELDRGSLAARVFERVVLRVDNLHLGTVGIERVDWVARLAAVWLEPTQRFPLIYTAQCLRLARRSTGWVVVRNCGTTSS